MHTVIPGHIYRSAILSKNNLITVIKKYKIKSVLNLTGNHSDDRWYRDEKSISRNAHIRHVDFSLPAHGKINHRKLQSLVKLLQQLPQPLLLHCKQGADRTGLASAILIILHGNYVSDDWQDQVSWWYNLLSPSSVGFVMMQDYRLWLTSHKLADNTQNFMLWAYNPEPVTLREGWFLT